VCAVLNGKRAALKSHISSDGFRTPNVKLMWGDSSWVEFVDNGIRYGLFIGLLMATSKLKERGIVWCTHMSC
jgi:tRNA G37 N-methylase Trm5